MIFKICGLKNKKSLLCCEKNNADFFGMIFYEKSPRNITLNEAKTLISTSKKLRIKPVGVFVDCKINDLYRYHTLFLIYFTLVGYRFYYFYNLKIA